MGAVPLLSREGEVDLARRMERGKLRMQKPIRRSAWVQRVVVELAGQLKKGAVELEAAADLGDVAGAIRARGTRKSFEVTTERAR